MTDDTNFDELFVPQCRALLSTHISVDRIDCGETAEGPAIKLFNSLKQKLPVFTTLLEEFLFVRTIVEDKWFVLIVWQNGNSKWAAFHFSLRVDPASGTVMAETLIYPRHHDGVHEAATLQQSSIPGKPDFFVWQFFDIITRRLASIFSR